MSHPTTNPSGVAGRGPVLPGAPAPATGWHPGGVQVWRSLEQVPPSWRREGSVATVGTYDGLHRGHRHLLDTLVAHARSRGLPAVAVTFDRHPLSVLRPGREPQALITPADRMRLMADAGIDAVLELAFTPELAAVDARLFVEDVLLAHLGAVEVVVGHDAHFGKAGEGDLALLSTLAADLGFAVTGVPAVSAATLGEVGGADPTGTAAPSRTVDGTGLLPDPERRWSSTWARQAIAAGDVAQAAAVLGRWHRTVGTVVHGDARGRELGYPTANLEGIEVAVPADGVYAGWFTRWLDGAVPDGADPADRVLPCAVSIGTNPTFSGTVRRVEAYVLDRTDLDLYGEVVGVDYVQRLRGTRRFDGIEPLVAQMARDTARCAEVLAAATIAGP